MDKDEEIKERLKKEWGVNSNSESYWNFEKIPLKEVYTIDSFTIEVMRQWEYIHGLATGAAFFLSAQKDETLQKFGENLWDELNTCYDEVKRLIK